MELEKVQARTPTSFSRINMTRRCRRRRCLVLVQSNYSLPLAAAECAYSRNANNLRMCWRFPIHQRIGSIGMRAPSFQVLGRT